MNTVELAEAIKTALATQISTADPAWTPSPTVERTWKINREVTELPTNGSLISVVPITPMAKLDRSGASISQIIEIALRGNAAATAEKTADEVKDDFHTLAWNMFGFFLEQPIQSTTGLWLNEMKFTPLWSLKHIQADQWFSVLRLDFGIESL